jgi:hypothetical protein
MERTQDMQVMPSTFIMNSMVFECGNLVSEGVCVMFKGYEWLFDFGCLID